ncbi:MAG: XdhC family protein [Actinomycetota bacterium]|nr:MAG: XdhC family protein [Actinomycetota bacterium]
MDIVNFPNSHFVLARAVALKGFGGRRAGELLVIDRDGACQGSLFGGAANSDILHRSAEMASSGKQVDLMTVAIGDRDAVGAGLACGGEAEVLLNQSSALPAGFTGRLSRRVPVALATVISGPHNGLVMAVSADSDIGILNPLGASEDRIASLKGRLRQALARRFPASQIEESEGEVVALEVFSPPTFMVIVGGGELGTAILNQGLLLGWSGSVVDNVDEGLSIVQKLGSNDALIVLSHDHGIGIPIISEVLKGSASTYVGGLGSRHTQEKRSELLLEAGFSPAEVERIYGPIGLDLGSRTPEETALAICAEILAHISARDSRPLKDSTGPING